MCSTFRSYIHPIVLRVPAGVARQALAFFGLLLYLLDEKGAKSKTGARQGVFWKKQEPIEPSSTPQWAPDREATLVLELHRIDATRRKVGKAIVDFRKRNTATVDGVVKHQADKLSARPELDRVWSDLFQADAKLLESRNAILKELSEIRCPKCETDAETA